MSERRLQILEMYEVGGLSKAEIARQLGITRWGVRYHLPSDQYPDGPRIPWSKRYYWTPAADAMLKELYGVVLVRDVAERLSEKFKRKFTRNMVIGRADRLGLSG